MRRRLAPLVLALGLTACAPATASDRAPRAAAPPAVRDFDGWWQRQRDREAADRFWNGPREQRRAATRDQVEQWERQKDRRTGRPHWPF
jgi:hypothetical protein